MVRFYCKIEMSWAHTQPLPMRTLAQTSRLLDNPCFWFEEGMPATHLEWSCNIILETVSFVCTESHMCSCVCTCPHRLSMHISIQDVFLHFPITLVQKGFCVVRTVTVADSPEPTVFHA